MTDEDPGAASAATCWTTKTLAHTLDPEQMAGRFVDYFGLSARPALSELTALAERAGFRHGAMRGRWTA